MPRLLRACFLFAFLMLVLSCKRSEERARESARPDPAMPMEKADDTKKGEPSVQQGERLQEHAVKELLSNWLQAQNSGKFSSYSASYAQKFSGMKKVGTRSFRMDRTRWLADREPMFKRKVSVQALNVEMTLSGEVAVVRFEQHWASKVYEDRGPKVMTIVLEEGRPKIAREEMLASQVLGKLKPKGTLPIYIVHYVGRTAYAIVGEGAVTQAPVVHAVEGGYDVLGPANLSQSPEMSDWQGRQLLAFDAAGKACETVTGSVFALARVLPHFGMENQWKRDGISKKERAMDLFSMSRAQFAVELPSTGTGCGRPVLAQLAGEDTPEFAVEFDDGDLYQAAFEAFKKDAEVQKISRLYRAERGPTEKMDWMEVPTVRKSLKLYEFKRTKKRFAWVSLHTGDGCGGWEGGQAMLFEIESGAKPKFKALAFEEEGGYPLGRLSALLDVDGDGQLEYLHHSSVGSDVKLYEHHGRPVKELHFSNWDCGC